MDGSNTMVEGSYQLLEGSNTLVEGPNQLTEGSNTLAEGSSHLIENSNTQVDFGGSQLAHKGFLHNGKGPLPAVRIF